ncbi:hypothetical protein ABGT15_08990 [Flavobacterium enshiense]|uniref:hypothetical protein n=1 Tax=Flavobacterium enshiense TaxID=1341165 RepID=UPI00345D332C
MTVVLFLLSTIMFQMPFGIYQHTVRRFKRMQAFNPLKSFDYEFENGRFEDNIGLSALVFVSGLIFAAIPLFVGLDFHWLILIVGNLISLYVVTPFIALMFYPKESIYTSKSLKIKSVLYIVFGVVFLLIALAIK